MLRLVPSTFLADLLTSQMRHGSAYYPAWLSFTVVGATTGGVPADRRPDLQMGPR